MLFFIYFKIQNPKGTAPNMTEPHTASFLMPQLGVFQCTLLPGNYVCQSQLSETGQREYHTDYTSRC